jgi:2-oxoglutarate dehydrogenase E2 component (dihydrolipoamide succinyltransferase)
VPEKGCETMSQIDILLPKMGESVAEATIIKWLKNEGDRVEADEPLVEIATDKVDSEVPAPRLVSCSSGW